MPRKQAWEKGIEASGGGEAVVGKCRRYAEHVARWSRTRGSRPCSYTLWTECSST
jgi:hypothetical protein